MHIDFSKINYFKNYSVAIELNYSIEGRSLEYVYINNISGRSLHTLLLFSNIDYKNISFQEIENV